MERLIMSAFENKGYIYGVHKDFSLINEIIKCIQDVANVEDLSLLHKKISPDNINEIRNIFSKPEEIITNDQKKLTTLILGLDSRINSNKIKYYFIIESFRLLPHYLVLILKITLNKLKK